jgi:glutathione S-transferase
LAPAEDSIRLYELALENGCAASPYVWRIRYALEHKGSRCESVPLGFTEIPAAFDGRFKTVPVIGHSGGTTAQSWDIDECVDRAFPGRPARFPSAAEQAMVRLIPSGAVKADNAGPSLDFWSLCVLEYLTRHSLVA